MTQTARMSNFKWLVIACLAVLSGAMLYQNARLSRSVEALEALVESLPVPKQAGQTAPNERPPEAEVKIKAMSPQEDMSMDDARLGDELRRQEEIIRALASRMLATGTLALTVADLERQFAEEIVDPEWGDQQEIRIQTEFVNSESLVSYQLSKLECRRTICKGLVQSFDTQSFESYGASLAVALTEFESIDLAGMHVQSRDANSAQVFFTKKDSIDE